MIARAFFEVAEDLCIAGNPAIFGVCGNADCVCAKGGKQNA